MNAALKPAAIAEKAIINTIKNYVFLSVLCAGPAFSAVKNQERATRLRLIGFGG